MTRDLGLHRLLAAGELDLPLPGSGRTAERHRRLLTIARRDVSIARLAEAHCDAVAILAEAGRSPEPGAVYGVWASESADRSLAVTRLSAGWMLHGSKSFCTGAGIVDRALVTVTEPTSLLVDLDLRSAGSRATFDHSGWRAGAFRCTRTATMTIHGVALNGDDVIGGPRFYLDRPGFWHGACGPASCWAGGAIGLVDHAREHAAGNPHALAHVGAMIAAAWAMDALLAAAGDEIDNGTDSLQTSQTRALTVRHLVESHVTDIMARFGRALGPRPLAFDDDIIDRMAEVQLYVRQVGGERDLEAIGASQRQAVRPTTDEAPRGADPRPESVDVVTGRLPRS